MELDFLLCKIIYKIMCNTCTAGNNNSKTITKNKKNGKKLDTSSNFFPGFCYCLTIIIASCIAHNFVNYFV